MDTHLGRYCNFRSWKNHKWKSLFFSPHRHALIYTHSIWCHENADFNHNATEISILYTIAPREYNLVFDNATMTTKHKFKKNAHMQDSNPYILKKKLQKQDNLARICKTFFKERKKLHIRRRIFCLNLCHVRCIETEPNFRTKKIFSSGPGIQSAHERTNWSPHLWQSTTLHGNNQQQFTEITFESSGRCSFKHNREIQIFCVFFESTYLSWHLFMVTLTC